MDTAEKAEQAPSFKGVVRSMGLVFGDIGTSPIYTLTVLCLLTDPTPDHIIGVISLILWTLTLLVSVEYGWLAMSLGRHGEGGTIVLREALLPMLRSGRQIGIAGLFTYISVSLMIGDGVITPAISILSSVEGIQLLPRCQGISRDFLLLIAGTIACLLFAIQKKGADKVSIYFGPIMLVWFVWLAVSGMIALVHTPMILKALNPWCGIKFIVQSGWKGFFILSEVILCATGGEALYADMGHLGRKPIVRAWYFVFAALVLCYLGQGAYVIRHPKANLVLFEMIHHQFGHLYFPFLILSILATVIASQAMISGIFSIVYQAIRIRALPRLKVNFTSAKMSSQIYIGFVNGCLLIAVLLVMFSFKTSDSIAAAYGLAVTGTMTFTGILMTWIFIKKKNPLKMAVAAFVTCIDLFFLFSSYPKLPHGGYWSLTLASIPFALILIETYGDRRLLKAFHPMPLKHFLKKFKEMYRSKAKIEGTALFLVRDPHQIPPYMVRTLFTNGILYEESIMVYIKKIEAPFGKSCTLGDPIAEGLRSLEIRAGYMEYVDVEEILKAKSINERTIFFGIQDIHTRNILLSVFGKILRLAPSVAEFYQFPVSKLHGVIIRFVL